MIREPGNLPGSFLSNLPGGGDEEDCVSGPSGDPTGQAGFFIFEGRAGTGLLFEKMGEAVGTLDTKTGWLGAQGGSEQAFLIERQGTAIQILITNLGEVTIDYVRRVIAKEYARLRRDAPRRGWGERSGRKERIHERNRWYRDEYRKLREANRRVAAERTMETVLQMGKEKFGELGGISVERLKRILYAK